MAGLDPTGTPWKADEIALIVAGYFEMLQLDATGQHFVKAHRNAELQRLISKFDPAVRDQNNRSLGRAGEETVVRFEQARLKAHGREDLAKRVRWVADIDGDGAGHDVLSFHGDGRETLLEVKTTNGGKTTPFFLSENERSLSQERSDAFQIVRLYDFSRAVRGFTILQPLESSFVLSPAVWKAGFGQVLDSRFA